MYAVTFEKDGQAVCLAPDEIAADDEIAFEISAKTKLTLLIYPQFQAWGFPEKNTTVTMLDVDGHSMEFYGRVTDVQDSMDSAGKYCRRVTCANEMDFLDDTRTAATIPANTYTMAILTTLFNAHNATVGANSPRRFEIGNITAVAGKKLADDLTFDYTTTLEAIKKVFVENFGAEIRTRRIGGVNYLDVGKFGSQSNTVIKIGDNLQNIRASYSAANRIVTRLIPLGGVGYDGKRLTIEQAPENTSGNIYIDNAEMRAKYGIHEGVMIVNDLVKPNRYTPDIQRVSQQLYEIGVEAAAALSVPAVEITLSALDLQKLGLSGYSGFALGNTHMTICPKLGIYNDLRITGLKRKLSSPQNTELTISTVNKVRDKYNSNLSAKLAAIDKNTNIKIDSNSYTYTSIVNNHFDGVENLKKVTKTQYDQTTKDPKTAYFVDDNGDYTLWLGEDQINLGGGGGSIQFAAVLTSEQQQYWIPGHDLVPVDFRGQAQVWYGQAPARFICQGARMLYNVARADIVEDDIMTELALQYWDDTIQRVKVFVYQMYEGNFNNEQKTVIRLGAMAYNVDAFGVETLIGWAAFGYQFDAYVPSNYTKLTIGFVHNSDRWGSYNGTPGPMGAVYLACMADDVMYRYEAMPDISGCFMNSSAAAYRVRRFANDAELHFAQALTITTEPTEE